MEQLLQKRGHSLMRKLAALIEAELKNQEICAVYNSELARIWPKSVSSSKRKQQIKNFAKKHELAVTLYDVGLCAIFEKAQSPALGPKRVLLLEGNEIKPLRKRRG